MTHDERNESRRPDSTHHDVIVIGSGAGGSTIAHRLAATGKRILVLERGKRLPREPENWNSREVFVAKRYQTGEMWLDRRGRAFRPQAHYGAGGNTKVYGGALFRLRERDFSETRLDGRVSPAWPVGYAEFAPYYLEAERLYQVHGQRGSDPAEPPCAQDYAHPAISHDPLIQRLFDGLARAGCKPFPLPLALLLDEASPATSACVRCAKCDGYPCPVRGKADAEIICLNPALAHDNVTLITGAFVERLETSSSGREVTAVRAVLDGQPLTLTAGVVVVACGAINSAALLLRSGNEAHPAGLANASGIVGRHYMCHNNSALMAVSRERNDTNFQKTFGLNDFYGPGADGEPPLGHVQLLGKTDAGQLAAMTPVAAPDALLGGIARHAVDFWLMSEDFADPENRVTVTRDGQIQLAYRGNNQRTHRRLRKRFQGAMDRANDRSGLFSGNLYPRQGIGLSAVSHQCGTIRFGRDARTSALNADCRAHDIDNLYVADSSFFPSSGAINPTLTIYANALRVGDIIKERLQ